MPLSIILSLYLAMLAYAAIAFFLAPVLPLATIVLGFGLLVIPYLFLEWVFTPFVAAAMGFQARWSLVSSIVLGLPLTVLTTSVTPVVSSDDSSLPVPVPWLAMINASRDSIGAVIQERLVWWISVYLLCMLAGRLSRLVWRVKPPNPSSFLPPGVRRP